MRNILFTMISLLLSIFVCMLIWWQWRDYGVVEEQEKTFLHMSKTQYTTPQIYAVSRRVMQNEKVEVSGLAKATDVDGCDLSRALCCYDGKGNRISGFFDTHSPGKYLLRWVVRSRVNGRQAEKQILVLVDGRASV